MVNRVIYRCIVLIFLAGVSSTSLALTPAQLLTPECRSDMQMCAQQPALQYYLGGVFDALAFTNHHLLTEGKRIYCSPEKKLFNHFEVLVYLSQHTEYQQQNVAVGVTHYLRDHGECPTDI